MSKARRSAWNLAFLAKHGIFDIIVEFVERKLNITRVIKKLATEGTFRSWVPDGRKPAAMEVR